MVIVVRHLNSAEQSMCICASPTETDGSVGHIDLCTLQKLTRSGGDGEMVVRRAQGLEQSYYGSFVSGVRTHSKRDCGSSPTRLRYGRRNECRDSWVIWITGIDGLVTGGGLRKDQM